ARPCEGAARPADALPAAGVAARSPDLGRPLALPAALVPAVRRLLRALDDPSPFAEAARRRHARRPPALPRVADAAPPRADASFLSIGLRDQPLRARGAGGCGEAPTLTGMAQAPALPTGFELPLEPRLPRIGSIDAVALEERAASLAKRSIKKDAKVWALQLAIRCTDLTTLEGADTPGKVAALSSKAIRPDPSDPSVPSVAAVCVYPNLVPVARERLEGTGVKVAAVATGFPSGQYPTPLKIADVRSAVE